MTDRGRLYEHALAKQAAWEQERARIAQILDAFSRAPISMASIQPILELSIELNKEPR